jgi:hypothetical protein
LVPGDLFEEWFEQVFPTLEMEQIPPHGDVIIIGDVDQQEKIPVPSLFYIDVFIEYVCMGVIRAERGPVQFLEC